MNKLIVFLIIFIFIITGLVSANVQNENNLNNTSILSEKIIIDNPIINEKDEFIYLDLFESNQNYFNSGKPILPKIVKTYEFPFGTKINNVEVNFSNSCDVLLSKPIKPLIPHI